MNSAGVFASFQVLQSQSIFHDVVFNKVVDVQFEHSKPNNQLALSDGGDLSFNLHR